MTLVRRFLFENDFDAGETRRRGPSGMKATTGSAPLDTGATAKENWNDAGYSEADMQAAIEAARRQGEEAGIAKGRAEIEARHNRRLAQALAAVSAALDKITGSHCEAVDRTRTAIELALAIARKLHPALAARQGLLEVEAALDECLKTLKKEPRLAAYLSPDLLDPVRAQLEQMITNAGFEGRVVLIGDETMGGGDCRIEWADGGVERDAAKIWQEIEAALDRFLDVNALTESPAGDEDGN